MTITTDMTTATATQAQQTERRFSMFTLPLFRKKYRTAQLMPHGTDTHCHLLPQTDDGTDNEQAALALIRAMKSRGLQGCICTPHISLKYPANTPTLLRNRFYRLRRLVAEKHPDFDLQLSAEYMMDERFAQLLDGSELLSWPAPGQHTPHLLVELSPVYPIGGWADLLTAIRQRGYTPVLAHPERYCRFLDLNELMKLHRKGIRFQGNIGSTEGFYGESVRQLCLRLSAEGLYSWWGSDAHSAAGFNALPLRK